MSLRSRLTSFARNLFRRPTVERELNDELRAYVDLVADDRVRRGDTPAQAQRRARVETGGVEQVKEEVRDVRSTAFVDVLRRDVRFAARALIKTPAFTIAAVL